MAAEDRGAKKAKKATDETVPAGSTKPSVAGHPKAARRVRQAREAAGLLGFLGGLWLSLGTHTPTEAVLRGLIAGAACYVVIWGAAVLLCRHLILAELKSREHALAEAAAARLRASEDLDQPFGIQRSRTGAA